MATLKDRDIAARGDGGNDGIGDDQILDMLGKMVRQRRESVTIYEAAGRTELAEREAEEISVIEDYMPRPLDQAETESAVRDVIAELGATSIKDMGRTMAALKKKYAGRMDTARASGLVKTILTGG